MVLKNCKVLNLGKSNLISENEVIKMSNTPYVLIIGSSNMDLNIYSERLPKPGETVTGGIFNQSLGGKGANQAVASVRSGSSTIFIGKIGKDSFGRQMIDQLTAEGINMEHVIEDPDSSSGVAFIMIDENGENMISVAPGANFKLTPEEIKNHAELIKNASAMVVQMEIPIDTIKEIFTLAENGNVVKLLNPAPLKPIPLEVLEKIDIITPNEGELIRLHELVGFNRLQLPDQQEMICEMSKNLASKGIKTIITTLGSKGSLVYESDNDESTFIPAFKVKAVDTVGAGDCFNGVLASRISKGDDLLTAVRHATAAASIAVTRRGAQASMPFENEIEERYQELQEST